MTTEEEKQEVSTLVIEKKQEEAHHFHSVENFRDLAEPLKEIGLSSKIIFRSASLDIASKEDIEALVGKFNIRTILDLRAKDDTNTKSGPFQVFPRQRKVRLAARINTAASHSHKRRVINRGLASKTIMINFTGAKYRRYVWSQLDNDSRPKLVLYRVVDKNKAAKLVGSHVLAKGGLAGLYCSFIDYSSKAICMALKVLVSAINYPILIHCAQGKDRTGIVTALALSAIGVDEEIIVDDYVQSKVGLERIHDRVVKDMEAKGLGPEFADAPPEAIKYMFKHIKDKFGSVDKYLDSIGFVESLREDLKQTLLHGAKDFMDRMKPQLRKDDEEK